MIKAETSENEASHNIKSSCFIHLGTNKENRAVWCIMPDLERESIDMNNLKKNEI